MKRQEKNTIKKNKNKHFLSKMKNMGKKHLKKRLILYSQKDLKCENTTLKKMVTLVAPHFEMRVKTTTKYDL
jgi:hypothetical protein